MPSFHRVREWKMTKILHRRPDTELWELAVAWGTVKRFRTLRAEDWPRA